MNTTVFKLALCAFLVFFLCSCGLKERAEMIYYGFKYHNSINLESDSVYKIQTYDLGYKELGFNEQGRIFYAVQVWGVLKFNPHLDEKKDINELFFSYYYKIKQATTKTEFNIVLKNMISESYNLQDLPSVKNTHNITSLYDTNYFSPDVASLILNLQAQSFQKSRYITQTNLGVVKLKETITNEEYNKLYPSEEMRVWGLSNYWNFINYYYVYKDLMDEDWKDILYRMIPKFVSAGNFKDYILAVHELTSTLKDCHSMVDSDSINFVFGKYAPNFRIKKIQDTFIVHKILVPQENNPIAKGDVILSINNIPLSHLSDSLKHYFSSANQWTESRNICRFVLHSFEKSNKIIYLRNNVIDTIELNFFEYQKFWEVYQDSLEAKKDISCVKWFNDIAYLSIEDLQQSNFSQSMDEMETSGKLILDIRGYPSYSVSIKLANWALPKKTKFFKPIYANATKPGVFNSHDGFMFGGENNFKKKQVIILVDETTQSEAEFLVMALQQHPNTKVIGNTTAGSDGNVSYVDFPGKIRAWFSGIGIVYPDGTQTQRIGIKINKLIEPSVSEIQGDRDIILETAIKEMSN